MRVTPGRIEGLALIEPKVHGDARGFFLQSWNEHAFRDAGIDAHFVQDNHSRSQRGVIRGMHFQDPMPQGKLVRVVAGRAFDVAVDLRRSSPTFGQWEAVELSASNHRMFWIPEGFAHGFLALDDDTELLYKCTAPYAPEHEHILAWDDPDLAIDWPLDGLTPKLSGKDREGTALADMGGPR